MSRVWYELLPDKYPGTNTNIGGGNTFYFQHSFNTGSDTSVRMFFRTTWTNIDGEIIVGIYKAGTSTNILLGTSNVSNINGIVHNSGPGTISFTPTDLNNTGTTPNGILNNLSANSKYYVITHSAVGNDTITPDSWPYYEMNASFENASGVSKLFTYDAAQSGNFSTPWNGPPATPGAPTNLSATPGNGSVSISFTAGSNGGSTITNYMYSTNNGTTFATFSPAQASSPVVITGLTNGTEYVIKLKAINQAGEGEISSSVTATPRTIPAAPTSLSAAPGDQTATITFTPGNNGGTPITNYKYSINGGSSFITFNPAKTTGPFVIPNLTNGTNYTIILKAMNIVGDGAAAQVDVTPLSLAGSTVLSSPSVVPNMATFINNIKTVTTSSVVSLVTLGVNLSAAGTAENIATARKDVIQAIFESNSNTTNFKTTREDLSLASSAVAKQDVVVFRPSASINATPVAIDTLINSTTSIYASLSSIGEINKFAFGANEFNVTKTGATTFTLTDSTGTKTYTKGQVITYNGLSIEFGSVIISTTYSSVVVNFEVEITGNSNLDIFGETFVAPTNIIEATTKLPVNALYDADTKEGLIELWEPSSDPNNIKAQLASTNSLTNGGEDLSVGGGVYKSTLKTLAKGIHRVLCDSFNCVNASPFSDNKYKAGGQAAGAAITEYTTQRDFARVALGAFAHYLFGHVDATAAITNDTAFVVNMLSLNNTTAGKAAAANGTAIERYNQYSTSIVNEINTSDITAWTNKSGSVTDANLARRVVAAIVGKGLNVDGTLKESAITNSLSDEDKKKELSYIVRQIVGQDATRLMNEDNSERTLNVHRLLRFYENDILYFNIKLNTPVVTVATGQQTNINSNSLQNSYEIKNYTLKVTLGPKETL